MGSMLALGIIGLAMALAGAGTSGAYASQAKKKIASEQSIIEKNNAAQEALYNRQRYQNITDRTEVVDMLRKLDEQNRSAAKRDDAIATITGASDEAKTAMADSRANTRAGFLANLASNASMLHDQYDNDWKNRLDNYTGQQVGMADKMAGVLNNQADQWSQMASNAYSTSFNMLGAYGKAKAGIPETKPETKTE